MSVLQGLSTFMGHPDQVSACCCHLLCAVWRCLCLRMNLKFISVPTAYVNADQPHDVSLILCEGGVACWTTNLCNSTPRGDAESIPLPVQQNLRSLSADVRPMQQSPGYAAAGAGGNAARLTVRNLLFPDSFSDAYQLALDSQGHARGAAAFLSVRNLPQVQKQAL